MRVANRLNLQIRKIWTLLVDRVCWSVLHDSWMVGTVRETRGYILDYGILCTKNIAKLGRFIKPLQPFTGVRRVVSDR